MDYASEYVNHIYSSKYTDSNDENLDILLST